MGEFAQLNYLICGVMTLLIAVILSQRKRWIAFRWWTFSLIQLLATFVLLHPILLVLVYWQLVMDNQRIFPYPYTPHDRISFSLYLLMITCSFSSLIYIQVVRWLPKFKARWHKIK